MRRLSVRTNEEMSIASPLACSLGIAPGLSYRARQAKPGSASICVNLWPVYARVSGASVAHLAAELPPNTGQHGGIAEMPTSPKGVATVVCLIAPESWQPSRLTAPGCSFVGELDASLMILTKAATILKFPSN